MIILNTQAIVLKSVRYKENDLILTLFTRKLGKISAVARGAKKSKSAFLSSSQVFAYSNYTLKKKGEMYTVSQTEIIKSFYDIAYDIDSFSYATYITKLTETVTFENQTNNRLFLLLAKTLNYYTIQNIDKFYLTRIFEIKLLDYLGIRPVVNKCVCCGIKVGETSNFNVYEGGVTCTNCTKNSKDNVLLDVTTVKVIEYILSNEIDVCVKAKVSKYILYELEKLLRKYLLVHIDNLNLKSLYVLYDIKNYKGAENNE